MLLEAARAHLLSRNQPDSIASHFEFLNRTTPGPAIVVVEDVKLGRQVSVLHVALYQHALLPQGPWITAGTSRKCVVAYVTNGNISLEKGMTLRTTYSLPSPPPPVDLAALVKSNGDAHWKRQEPLYAGTRLRFTDNTLVYIPRRGHPDKSVNDYWLRLACGERWTNPSLIFVPDATLTIIEGYRGAKGQKEDATNFAHERVDWYPTLLMNLEIKRGVPEGGAEWLYMRTTLREARNGRFDMEFVILNEAGELVAHSQHVNLVVDSTRNAPTGKVKSSM